RLDQEVAELYSLLEPFYGPIPGGDLGGSSSSKVAHGSDSEHHDDVHLVRAESRPDLFDYQSDLVNSALQTLASESATAGLISLPTGAGKTRTGVYLIFEYLASRPRSRVVWIAPTRELVEQ